MKYKNVAALILSLMLFSAVSFASVDKARIRITTVNPDHTCATNFLEIYEQSVMMKDRAVDVGVGNLSNLTQLLIESGLPVPDAEFYTTRIQAISLVTDAVEVLGEVLPFVKNVWNDEGLFGVSVPSRISLTDVPPFMSHHPANAPFKYVGTFATAPKDIAVLKRDEYPNYDATTFWNGIVFYPLALNQAQDQATAYVTTVSKFYNKVAQLHAESLLGQLARHIQRGGKLHLKLTEFVSADGKEIDYGFARMFAETRGAVAELQAAQYALTLIGCPAAEISRWAQHHQPIIVGQAFERLRAEPTAAQPIIDKLGVTEKSFLTDWKKLTSWVNHRVR